jgi:hypothetical protein
VLSDPQLRKEHDDWIAQQERDEAASTRYSPGPQPARYSDPETTIGSRQQSAISLWNPNAAANWSLLFSPIFGAWLHAKNWAALGEKARANQSMAWVYVGGAVLLTAMFLSEKAGRAIGIGYLFGWYFSSAKSQTKYVKDKLGSAYVKKGWFKPLGIAATSFVAFVIGAGLILSADPETQKETALDEISGVWKVSDEKTMVAFQLAGSASVVRVDDQPIPVTVDKFDSDNKVLTLLVRNNPSTVWSVRQIFDENGHFTLQVTLEDGTQLDLSYVRNL